MSCLPPPRKQTPQNYPSTRASTSNDRLRNDNKEVAMGNPKAATTEENRTVRTISRSKETQASRVSTGNIVEWRNW